MVSNCINGSTVDMRSFRCVMSRRDRRFRISKLSRGYLHLSSHPSIHRFIAFYPRRSIVIDPSSISSSLSRIIMYTALNPSILVSAAPFPTYQFLARAYFNVVLPAFIPSNLAAFDEGEGVKKRTGIIKYPFLTTRAMKRARVEAGKARGDEGDATTTVPSSGATTASSSSIALMSMCFRGPQHHRQCHRSHHRCRRLGLGRRRREEKVTTAPTTRSSPRL
ncbi:hypothetical protein GYMLUDRAFT_249897 [Collybiopsis luxurians FD-317 M1]|uniref:Uncharacterized protein n=1 Tax=Collybiopsis luxurians FD-317 M1 TaxID=944289 RepID=A0A0D0CGH3_9AGAR|nr:hypothetical protein GYMLUDRAFT_249897 [Collybiopsis luxurians FD-317 M1]